MPDVVDADVDEDDGGLFLQHVLVETLLAISNFMATDASTDKFDVEIGVGLGDGLGAEGDVATRAGPAAVIESPRKTMRSFFFRRRLLGVETSREGEDGQCGDEYEFHACCSALLLGEDGFDEIGGIDRIFEIVDELS